MRVNWTVTEPNHEISAGAMPGYRLVRRCGLGGFAEVWEAEAPGGFRVALKLVRPAVKTRTAELRAIEIIRGIRHPHLLPVFGAWQVDDLLVIGMELAEGSLWDRFREARAGGLRGIPRGELLGYFRDAASGVDFLNDSRTAVEGRPGVGVQHRDLKPQNILLVGGRAKVADFGMVRVMESSVASHTGTWTLPYAAPEFFHGQTTRQSDQYSFAVTYCQLRGGRLPFRGTAAQVMSGHLLREPDLEALPGPERPAVARALSKRPEDRWPDCRSLIEALVQAGSGEDDGAPDTLAALGPDDPDDLPGSSGNGRGAQSSLTFYGGGPTDSVMTTPSYDDLTPQDPDKTPTPDDLPGPDWDDAPSSVTIDCGGSWDRSASSDSSTGELFCGDVPPDRRGPALPDVGPVAGSPAPLWMRSAAAVLGVGLALGAVSAGLISYGPLRGAPPARLKPVPRGPGNAIAAATSWGTPGAGSHTHPARPIEPVDKPQSEIVARYKELPEDPFAPAPTVEPQAHRDDGPALVGPVVPDPGEPEAEVPDAIQPRGGEPSRTAAAVSRPGPLDGFPLGFRVVPGGLFPTYASTSGGVDKAELTGAGNAAPGDASVAVVTGERLAVTAGRSSPRVPLDSGKAAYERGRDDLRRKDYKRAVEGFTEAIRHDPGHADAHYWRGLAEHLDGRLSQALADYGEAIRRSPDNADAYLLRGQVYRALGAPERAAADLGAAVLRRPGDVAARVARGQVYHELGDYEKAMADLDEAIRLRPDDASVHYRRGLVRYHTGDLAGAVADYSTAIRLEPNHANAYRARSEAFARRGLLDRATADRDAYDRLVARQAGSRPKGRFSTQKVTSPHG